MVETDYILQYHDYRGSLQTHYLTGVTISQALEDPTLPDEALENDFTIHKVTASHTKKDLLSSGNYDDVLPE